MPPDEDTASRQTLAAGDGMAMMADYRSPIPRLLTTTAVKKCSILELLYMPSKTGGCSPFTMLRPLPAPVLSWLRLPAGGRLPLGLPGAPLPGVETAIAAAVVAGLRLACDGCCFSIFPEKEEDESLVTAGSE